MGYGQVVYKWIVWDETRNALKNKVQLQINCLLNWVGVTTDVPQGLVSGLLVFLIYFVDLTEGLESEFVCGQRRNHEGSKQAYDESLMRVFSFEKYGHRNSTEDKIL